MPVTGKLPSQSILAIERIIGYQFRHQRFLLEALQAPGLHQTADSLPIAYGNKKIASVGDAVLELLVRERVYRNGTSKEAAHRVRYRLVSNKNLIEVCKRSGIHEFLRLDDRTAPASQIIAASSMEGIIGGVYMDGGLKSASNVLSKLGLLPKLATGKESSAPLSDQGDGRTSHDVPGLSSA